MKPDREIELIGHCLAELEALDMNARKRVARYIEDWVWHRNEKDWRALVWLFAWCIKARDMGMGE